MQVASRLVFCVRGTPCQNHKDTRKLTTTARSLWLRAHPGMRLSLRLGASVLNSRRIESAVQLHDGKPHSNPQV